MLRRTQSFGKGSVGHCRGAYKWTINNLDLDMKTATESKMFEAGGYKWMIVLYHCYQNSQTFELVKVFLVSCNPEAVTADIEFRLINENDGAENIRIPRKSKTACPFYFIYRHNLRLKQVLGPDGKFPLEKDIIVTFDIKNIRAATDAERRETKSDMRTIQMELVDKSSINECLGGHKAFGLVPLARKRACNVCFCSLVRYWAKYWADCVHWACKRRGNGLLSVDQCLNEAGLLTCFGHICEEVDGGFPWVTVLRGDKGNDEPSEKNKKKILIFCKLFEPPYEDLGYLGHFLIEESTSFPDLLFAVTEVSLPEDEDYKVYLEKGDQGLEDVTFEHRTLKEYGLKSGSTIIMKTGSEQLPTIEDVKTKLIELETISRLESDAGKPDPLQVKEALENGDGSQTANSGDKGNSQANAMGGSKDEPPVVTKPEETDNDRAAQEKEQHPSQENLAKGVHPKPSIAFQEESKMMPSGKPEKLPAEFEGQKEINQNYPSRRKNLNQYGGKDNDILVHGSDMNQVPTNDNSRPLVAQ